MGCLVSTVIGLGIIGFIGVSAVGLSGTLFSSGSSDMQEIVEEQHSDATQKIVVVDLNGVIMNPNPELHGQYISPLSLRAQTFR